ncbi:DUF3566 domain-containing protein [Mycobacterium shimoidei]|uniref:DUF3566 domain-containing protein n=1 Tax=Mycobacterium shimoidei TaxID=29313 RepID=UPI0008492E26|nr:DUF3566 domain-containing protein [Mycobacterium shimoidei]MCV7258798.1 DUF3566 domain-containing protein [Mycobacterium shimoidei]ODR15299.1 hypothetical protein BHQ16_00710 [Mycobacterium shimoidei]ORW79878.1 hypothetical protein AWC26_13305 [Mycobacterium shimoidei]
MTSPNEPGYPGRGDSSNGDGSVGRGAAHRSEPHPTSSRSSETGGAASPPRAAGGRPSSTPPRPAGEAPAHGETRSAGHSPGVEARLTRFISGTAAPGGGVPPQTGRSKTPTLGGPAGGVDADSPPARGEGRRGEAYASELPDLSGRTPRPAPRRATPERAPETAASGADRPTARIQVAARSRGPVRASMQIRRIDPWSTLKVSLVLSVALFFVWMIAVAFLYLVLGGMGVWSKLNSNVGDLLNNSSGSAELVSSGAIFGGALLIGLVNIVLLTAMATIGVFVYNLTTDLIGGIEVTLADRD